MNAQILLQDEKQASGDLAGLAELSNLAGMGSSSAAFVNDQIEVLKSRRLMRNVVESNDLTFSYFIKGKIKSTEVLGHQSPLKAVILEPTHPRVDSVEYSFTIRKEGANYKVKDEINGTRDYQLNSILETPIGPISLEMQSSHEVWEGDLQVTYIPRDLTVDILRDAVSISPHQETQSFLVNFSMNYPLIAKAELVLNSLIKQYNDDVTYDKAQVTRATSNFINSRLELISDDLQEADSKVADFKDRNNMTDMEAEARLYMENASDNERKLVEYQTQLKLAEMMGEAVSDESIALLPSNIGLTDPSIETNIRNYNELVLEKDDRLKSATPDNPVVQQINSNIERIKGALRTSLNNHRNVIQGNIDALQNQKNIFEERLNQLPRQERGFKDISRQQQIVETLYLFLLQKREETEIKAAATPANLKIVDAAYGSMSPVAPRGLIVLVGMLFVGVLLPFCTLYIKFLLDNKIHSRRDIEERFNAPILGELPSSDDPIVRDNDRSALAEAFRILRTNIAFMLGKKKDSAVIFVTSTTSGEGKSFVTTNLSRILSMSGKKVLLIGADIRSPKVLDYLGLSHLQHTNIGITQYLINPDMPVENIVVKKPSPYDFDIVYSGYIAPNPAELLMNGHFKDIIEFGRRNYDFVLVDTAPVSLVTDTLLISDHADMTIYVARANYLDKRLLNVPKELYEDGKLKNMAVVINDVDFARGYGFGYGYGYGYVDASSVSIRAKLGRKIRKWLGLKKKPQI